MRQLGLLFGSTAHAAATTLAVFFAGLAVGSWFWGKRVPSADNPLRVFAWLEVGIAGTALLYFAVLKLFHWVYPSLYQSVGPGVILLLIKCLLATLLVFPPSFFMGGTIPAMGQFLIRRRELFGRTTAWIYGINTIGAALGVLLAAFVFVPQLGFRATCICALAVTGSIAVIALLLARGKQYRDSPTSLDSGSGTTAARDSASPLARPLILVIAFLSGFSVLALEVLWTRMFAQVHENSVYSFATVLVIVLVCLSLGALLASLIARVKVSTRQCLSMLIMVAGIVLSLSPLIFVRLTGNFSMIPTSGTFGNYVRKLFLLGFASIGPACLSLGTVFPFLMKSEQRFADRPGRSIGHLFAVNTVGSIVGSLLCGFLLLRILGMWWTVHAIAALYLLVAIALAGGPRGFGIMLRGIAILALILLVTALNPSNLPVIGTHPGRGPQRLVEVWETSDCSVAVVEDPYGNLAIKVNSNYILGSTDAVLEQAFQARVPLFAFPDTKRVFFLGIGTGMSAGAALDSKLFPSVEHVVACELVPEVVTAAKRYIAGGSGREDYTNGLFTDPRAEILVEDGRHYLMATNETFDMINADLFLPYRSGAGSLYSLEHFQNAKKRLSRNGVFVQWLPLFQLSDFEFGVISRTMLQVFEDVTLWRNNFVPGREIVALVGHNGEAPLQSCELDIEKEKRQAVLGKDWRDLPELVLSCNEQSITLFYCGNMKPSADLFAEYPVNTDDKPVIEYMAPRSMRKKTDDSLPPTMVGPRFADLVDQLIANCPPDRDPVLANRTEQNRRLPLAGAALHRAWVGYAMGKPDVCREAWEAFVREWTNQ